MVLGGCPEQSCMAKHSSSMQTMEKVWHANPESILQTMLKKTWCAVGLGASEPFENFLLALPLRAAALAVPPLARGSWMLGGSQFSYILVGSSLSFGCCPVAGSCSDK